MSSTTITKALLRGLAPLPSAAAKQRIFDDRTAGFIAEQRHGGVTFYFRYTDPRRRGREVKLGRLGDVTVDQARKQAELLRAYYSSPKVGTQFGVRHTVSGLPIMVQRKGLAMVSLK
jgi:hypothetical protein